ncbi:MAG: NAD(P)-binding protein [Ignavibacteriaceae bacterium]|nr:NAD(P)-binding protein [Ignavibacteriaceae bacterium]
MFDYLIIGSGFAGSVMAERLASQFNKKVLVVEKIICLPKIICEVENYLESKK